MALVNLEVDHILTWSSTCVITNPTGAGRFAIADTNFMFQLYFYQLKIMQKYFNNKNLVLKE